MVNIQGTTVLFLIFTTVTALMAVAFSGRAFLFPPIRPVVGNVSTTPCTVALTNEVLRLPGGLTCATAKLCRVFIVVLSPETPIFPITPIARFSGCPASPQRIIRARTVLCPPCTATLLIAKLLPTFGGIGTTQQCLTTLSARYLNLAAFPYWIVLALVQRRAEFACALGTAADRFTLLQSIWCDFNGLAAVRAIYLNARAWRRCIVTDIIQRSVLALTGTIAELFKRLLDARRNTTQCRAAVGAGDFDEHNKTSLTRGTDDVRGRLVSVSSRLGRFMTPLLSPTELYHIWLYSATNNALSIRENSRVSPQRLDAARGGDRRATATSFNRITHGGFS